MTVELLLPFRAPLHEIRDAVRIRSTLISSSFGTLRKRGLEEAYFAQLEPEFHEDIRGCIAGMWLPMELAMAHYSACDAMALSVGDRTDIARDVSIQTQGTFLATITKLARTAGVNVWTGLVQFQRAYDRVIDGGGSAVYKLGPKEARIEIVGLPLARIPYFRVGFRSYLVAAAHLFATRVYGHDVPALCGARTLAYRLAWA